MIDRFFLVLISLYRRALSPVFYFLGVRCRFHPSCSQYAEESIKSYGLLKSLPKIFWRLVRCAAWHPGGVDFPRHIQRRLSEDVIARSECDEAISISYQFQEIATSALRPPRDDKLYIFGRPEGA